MHSTSFLDCSALDLLAASQDAGATSEVDVGGGDVVQALVVAAVIVMLDEVGDARSRSPGR